MEGVHAAPRGRTCKRCLQVGRTMALPSAMETELLEMRLHLAPQFGQFALQGFDRPFRRRRC